MVLLDSATASEERRDENDNAHNDHEHRHREHPYVHEVAVAPVRYQDHRAHRDEYDPGDLQNDNFINLLLVLMLV